MKTLNSNLNLPLKWISDGNEVILRAADKPIVVMNEFSAGNALFNFDGFAYSIKKTGTWNSTVTIEREGTVISTMKTSFFKNTGLIEMANGNQYTCRVKNAPLVKLYFSDSNHKEILYYKLDASSSPRTLFEIVDSSINDYDLVMLLVLGCFLFRGMVKESDDANLIILLAAGA